MLVTALGAPAAYAQPSTVVVTGSVARQVADDAPYAITLVERDALRAAGPMVNLSEALVQVPGLVVNNRSNYAQDLQISSRGFGARAGFGVRGMRLYVDGIPAAGPDGQGQVSNFDLGQAQRVEVLRGPFSALYGNSSGGVIHMVSAPVREPQAEIGLDVGRSGLFQARANLSTPLGAGWDLRLGASDMTVEGFRPHSQAERQQANARLGWHDADDRVLLQAGYLNQPADDPLGLTRVQWDDDPYQTTPQALDYNTRKTLDQTQLGASWRHAFAGAGALRESQLALYAVQRGVTQWQSIPASAQGNPRHGGGVVDFDRRASGVDARLRWGWDTLDVVAGLALDQQADDRRGYENFTGTAPSQVLGVTGRLRRDELDRASTRDAYAQAEWTFGPGLLASAGLRHGQVKLSADDRFLDNGDDSGEVSYRYTNPAVGLRWQLDRAWQLRISAARGFEAPTLGELAYRPDGAGGFNEALQPQISRQLELGSRWRGASAAVDLTLFDVQVSDELAVMTNSGGRASYQNVGDTRRRGLELSGQWQLASTWRSRFALTRLEASYSDSFLACAGVPCSAPTVQIPAGNRIAGTQRGSAWADLGWTDAHGAEWALEARGASPTTVNDSNSEYAPGYALLALRWTRSYALPAAKRLEVLARVDNLLNRAYVGSVIVNDSNGRYYESGAPRSLLLGLRLVGGL